MDALRTGDFEVVDPPRLAKALLTWNRRSGWARLEIDYQGGAGAIAAGPTPAT